MIMTMKWFHVSLAGVDELARNMLHSLVHDPFESSVENTLIRLGITSFIHSFTMQFSVSLRSFVRPNEVVHSLTRLWWSS
mmetsp:Transcript_10605/g.17079  ORF Transcript_10605/g.17079 Transcript_10605/m.17079 type:complete len:80 (-) Transcript_10605:387-626(-)